MGDDEDRAAILKRRSRFIALAFTGITSATGAAGCYEDHGLGRDAGVDAATVPRLDAGEPVPCLGAPLMDAGPTPCLEPPAPDAGVLDAGIPADAEPVPCLEPPFDAGVPRDAAPVPCLDIAPDDAGPDADPLPCLTFNPPG